MNLKKYIKHSELLTTNYVIHSMDILDRINLLLIEKFSGDKNALALKLGKEVSEIEDLFFGVQNFTIFTISELEAAFEEPILKIIK